MRETDLASHVVDWLAADGWDVYQEVQPGMFAHIADIVAVRRGLLWVIECKLTLSLEVIGQAEYWRQMANWSSVAVPLVRHTSGRSAARRVCHLFGVGVLTVTRDGAVQVTAAPAMNRKPLDRLRNALHESQKTAAMAGTNRGGRSTPFRRTCEQLARYVSQHPACLLKEAIDAGQHHYASDSTARSCLAKWIKLGRVDGVRLERDGRKIRLFPRENQ